MDKITYTGFIEQDKLHELDENSRSKDLLQINSSINSFKKWIQSIRSSGIIGIIGPLGSGKSNFINTFMSSHKHPDADADKILFFKFDAWKYPDRKDLRENFVIETASQCGLGGGIVKEIDGEANKGASLLLDQCTKIFPFFGIPSEWTKFFLQQSPATRVFQLESIMTHLLNGIESEHIVFVIEDVDRAGSEGLFFLETLNYFIKEYSNNNDNTNKIIRGISLIGQSNYNDHYKRLSFNKSLDYVYHFKLNDPDFTGFCRHFLKSETGQEKIDDESCQLIGSFLSNLLNSYPDQITMRTIKHILRAANVLYQYLGKKHPNNIINWKMCILIAATKEVKINLHNPNEIITVYQKWERSIHTNSAIGHSEGNQSTPFLNFLHTLLQEQYHQKVSSYQHNTISGIYFDL